MNDATWKWITGGLLVVIVALVGVIWGSVVTDADLSNFVTEAQAKEMIQDYSPYNGDKKYLIEALERIQETLLRIEEKTDDHLKDYHTIKPKK